MQGRHRPPSAWAKPARAGPGRPRQPVASRLPGSPRGTVCHRRLLLRRLLHLALGLRGRPAWPAWRRATTWRRASQASAGRWTPQRPAICPPRPQARRPHPGRRGQGQAWRRTPSPDAPVYIYDRRRVTVRSTGIRRARLRSRRRGAGAQADPGPVRSQRRGLTSVAEIRLRNAADNFEFGAYHTGPEDARHGGLVLIQEIFGVTEHIRELADSYAADGYERHRAVVLSTACSRLRGKLRRRGPWPAARYLEATPWDEVAGDLAAGVARASAAGVRRRLLLGRRGDLARAHAAATGCAAASSFYGRRILELMAEDAALSDHPALRPARSHHRAGAGRGDPRGLARHPDPPLRRRPRLRFRSPRRLRPRQRPWLARLRTLQLFALNGGGRGDI